MDYKTKRTTLYMNEDKYEELKQYCSSRGMTVNGFIKALIDRYMREVEDAKCRL